MSTDKRVPGRSDKEVRRIAEKIKAEFKTERRRPVNILRMVRKDTVQTLYGPRRLRFIVVTDEEMPEAYAKTEFEKGTVTITCRRDVYDRANMGVGRDRMTLAHEYGHAVMHCGAPLYRTISDVGRTQLSATVAFESAEHQAKVFAAALLIHDEDAAEMNDADEISVEFGVSVQAAEICFERLNRKAERQLSASRVRKSADEAIATINQKPPAIKSYLLAPCSTCHKPTLLSIGSKVLCDTCGFIGDRFQDGDDA